MKKDDRAFITIQVDAVFKEQLKKAAENDNRSLSNLIEVILKAYADERLKQF